jgi:hypothetical protein
MPGRISIIEVDHQSSGVVFCFLLGIEDLNQVCRQLAPKVRHDEATNPKLEIRNSKQSQMTKSRNFRLISLPFLDYVFAGFG